MGLLRLLLAISVVIAHTDSFLGLHLTGGLVAVETFFIISGFYMTMILDAKYRGNRSYLLFISNRFLRLYPLYWIVLILTVLTSLLSFPITGDFGRLSPYINHLNALSLGTALALIGSNITIFGQDIIMFLGVDLSSGSLHFASNFRDTYPHLYTFLLIPQAWSMGIEALFYLLAPLVVRKSNSFVAVIIACSLGIKAFTYLYLGYNYDPWTYRFFPSEIALFMFGTISYRIYKHFSDKKYFNKVRVFAVCATFFSMIFLYQLFPFSYGYLLHAKNFLFYIVTSLSLPFVFELSKFSKCDRKIGELSYPIYLLHVLIISIVSPILACVRLQEFVGEATTFISICISLFLIKTISSPIERIRQSRIRSI